MTESVKQALIAAEEALEGSNIEIRQLLRKFGPQEMAHDAIGANKHAIDLIVEALGAEPTSP